MKSNRFIAGVVSLLLMVSCHGSNEHHGIHEEEGHIHELETEHAHEGEIHDHGHEHQANAEGHSDEIILSPEKAKAAGVVSEKIAPGEFYGIIPAGGNGFLESVDSILLVRTRLESFCPPVLIS